MTKTIQPDTDEDSMTRYASFPSPLEIKRENRDATALSELDIAGIPILRTTLKDPNKSNFGTGIQGMLYFRNGATVVFLRCGVHWSAESSPRLPYKPATRLNLDWAESVRAYARAGGTEEIEKKGCDLWHVDAQEGLNALVQALKDHFGPLGDILPTTDELVHMGLISNVIL